MNSLTPYVKNTQAVKVDNYTYMDSYVPTRGLNYLFDGATNSRIHRAALAPHNMSLNGDIQSHYIPTGSVAYGAHYRFI